MFNFGDYDEHIVKKMCGDRQTSGYVHLSLIFESTQTTLING